MKKITYILSISFGLFILSCDQNIYVSPNLNQSFVWNNKSVVQQSYGDSIVTGTGMVVSRDSIIEKLNGNELTVTHFFTTASTCEFTMATPTFTNGGKDIVLRFQDTALDKNYVLIAPGATRPSIKLNSFEVKFDASTIGTGNGRNVNINVLYQFPYSNKNVKSLVNRTKTVTL